MVPIIISLALEKCLKHPHLNSIVNSYSADGFFRA